MPNYTKGIYDTHTVTASLSDDHNTNSTVMDLSGFTQWDTNAGGLNPIDGFEVGSVFTVAAGAAAQQYEITAIDYRTGAAMTGYTGTAVTGYEAHVTHTPALTNTDKSASNSGELITRKFKGTQGSLATHLRKRHLGYI